MHIKCKKLKEVVLIHIKLDEKITEWLLQTNLKEKIQGLQIKPECATY